MLSSIGYDRGDSLAYFSGNLDEIGVWTSTLSNMDFVSLYNAGSGYGYPWSPSSLATTTYSARYYNYDALANAPSLKQNAVLKNGQMLRGNDGMMLVSLEQ